MKNAYLYSITATLLMTVMLLLPSVSAGSFSYNYLDNQVRGSVNNSYTTINNTYINQTQNVTVNSTQFSSSAPINLNMSWLQTFFNSVYYSISNPFGYYNSTTLPVTNLSGYVPYYGTIDNHKVLFGNANDSSFYYDGTNMVLNPKEVGTGILDVLGEVNTSRIRMAVVRIGNSETGVNNNYQTTTLVGKYAGRYNNGSANAFFGYNSGAGVSGASNIGQNNMGMGYYSLSQVTTGGNNVGIGSRSLEELRTGSNNIALGTQAGRYMNETSGNTLIGAASGLYNSGSNNVVIGTNAGEQLASSGNTFIGYKAGRYHSSATGYNVFIGNGVGQTSTAGNTLMIDNTNTNDSLIWGDFLGRVVKINGAFNVTGNTNLNGNLVLRGNFSAKRPYGMFSSTEDQTLVSADTAYPVTFNWTEDSYLITKTGNSNFTFAQDGDYLVEISLIAQTAVANKNIHVWPQIFNGTAWNNVPRSNTETALRTTGSDYAISVPFILDIHTTEKFRLMWGANDNGVFLNYKTNTSWSPETPSIIMTISKVSDVTT